jgi:hypothetical protein
MAAVCWMRTSLRRSSQAITIVKTDNPNEMESEDWDLASETLLVSI